MSALKATGESSAARCRPGRHGQTVRKKRRNPGACAFTRLLRRAQAPRFPRFFRAVRSRRLGRHRASLVSPVAFKADGLTERLGTSPFGTDTVRDRYQGLLFGQTTVFYSRIRIRRTSARTLSQWLVSHGTAECDMWWAEEHARERERGPRPFRSAHARGRRTEEEENTQ